MPNKQAHDAAQQEILARTKRALGIGDEPSVFAESRVAFGKLPKPSIADLYENKTRCQKLVKSTGTGSFDGDTNRCAKTARFTVDGVKLCHYHAGEAALNLALQQTMPESREQL